MSCRITWVDPNIVEGSPSMQNLLRSLPDFEQEGFDIRFVCIDAEPRHEKRILRRLPVAPIRKLRVPLFALAANLAFGTSDELRRQSGLIHSTGSNVFLADLVSIHFLPGDWMRTSLAFGGMPAKDLAQTPLYGFAAGMERTQRLINPRAHYHVVSEKLALSLQQKGVARERITVIPTPYDPERFNPEVRLASRQSAREEYGFSGQTRVFAFVSQGAYFRKGLSAGVEIVHKLRKTGRDAALMIIGGRGNAWQSMKDALRREYPASEAWLKITGFVPDLARAMSAADAFLFPSKYEGCAAVEVEAAALGLSLILTDHPGAETHLVDGENGVSIGFDPELAAAQLNRRFEEIRALDSPKLPNAITQKEWGSRMLAIYRSLPSHSTIPPLTQPCGSPRP